MTLEQILQNYFNCNKPFLKTPKRIPANEYRNEHNEYLTIAGINAYGELIGLVYDLGELIDGFNAEDVVGQLDSIVADSNY